ncbi:MAG: outer membrane protein transport protein, partial [Elusimicrobia bacterium]|nr:outer membrane protein transport protein [Elusimicrobiota bacterium]
GQLNENVYWGIGFFTRFGLGLRYENYSDWVGSEMGRSTSLQTFSINPVIAVRVNEELSIATGLEIMTLNFNQRKYFPMFNSGFEISGDSIAWGGNIGVFYRPLWADRWSAGLTYRTKVNHTVRGTVDSAMSAPWPQSGSASAALSLPDSISFGVAHRPTERLIIEGNVTGTFWSSYQTLRIDYNDTSLPSLVEHKNYRDVIRLSLGVEYALTPNWCIRAGYTFDQSPRNPAYMDTLVPAHDRNIYSLGLGFRRNNWAIDIAYVFYQSVSLTGTTDNLPIRGRLPISYTDGTGHAVALSFRHRL